MGSVVDLSGCRFNSWTVLCRGKNTKSGSSKWYAQCQCGAIKSVSALSLKNGSSKSCGCMKAALVSLRKASQAEDLRGRTFGKLTVIDRSSKQDKRKRPFWNCICECGSFAVVAADKLKSGHTSSCGCKVSKHGMSKSREFSSWKSMKGRCLNPQSPDYHNYGGRGITIIERWVDSFEAFYADMGERPDGMSLDRIDNEKGYSPENCRWATMQQQRSNSRQNSYVDIEGEVVTKTEAGRRYSISPTMISYREGKGMRGLDLVSPTRKWERRSSHA